MDILDATDTAAFKNAFQCVETILGACVYLQSDAVSNFMGSQINPADNLSALTSELINEVQTECKEQGKTWDVNPPRAPHFGGVLERAIGQVRQITQGCLIIREDRSLTYDEFNTMLHLASRIVKSAPLGDAAD